MLHNTPKPSDTLPHASTYAQWVKGWSSLSGISDVIGCGILHLCFWCTHLHHIHSPHPPCSCFFALSLPIPIGSVHPPSKLMSIGSVIIWSISGLYNPLRLFGVSILSLFRSIFSGLVSIQLHYFTVALPLLNLYSDESCSVPYPRWATRRHIDHGFISKSWANGQSSEFTGIRAMED